MAGTENSFLADIRAELRRNRLVPVIGAGVSVGAARLPNWLGAVRAGLRHLRQTRMADPAALAEAGRLLEAGELIPAAEAIAAQLKDLSEWAAWLRDTFRIEQEAIGDWSMLWAIFELMCPLVATTNYDRLLSFNPLQVVQSVSWDEPALLESALKDGRSVVHLHGIWDRPQSVVFGAGDYDRLVGKDAYRSFLRALWLDRTLLFIGCSFDGLQDPDFGRLLDWAHREFGQNHFRHYALLKAGSYDLDQGQHLLRHRIQVVEYGPSHVELPETIRDLNPHREVALTASANRIRELVNGQDPGNVPLLQHLLRRLLPATQNVVDIPAAASDLLARQSVTSDRFRQELFRLQGVAGLLIDREVLRQTITRLDSFTGIPEDEKERVRTVVLQAGRAFSLFPHDLLAALKQRNVAIHGAVAEGWSKMFMDDLSESAGYSEAQREILRSVGVYDPLDKPYSRENMHRVLAALEEILAADPLKVFPAQPAGLGVAPEGPSIAVGRKDRIDIYPFHRPKARSSVLIVGTPGLLGVEPVPGPGGPMLVGYTKSAVLAWNPRSSRDLVHSYEVDAPYGIESVTHLAAPDGLHTYVLTTGVLSGEMTHLVNFTPRDRIAVDPKLSDITAFPGAQLLCRDAHADSLVRLDPPGEPAVVLEEEPLLRELRNHQAVAGNETIQIAKLGIARLRPRSLATVRVLVNRSEPEGYTYESGCLVCELDQGDLHPVAFFRIPAESWFCTRLQDLGGGSFRIMCGVMSDRGSMRPMVFWSTAYSAPADFVLPVAGSGVETEADGAAVCWVDGSSALVGTGAILWSVDVGSGTSRVLDQDSGKPIRSIDLVDWKASSAQVAMSG